MPGNMVTSDFKIVEVVQRKGKFHVLLILGESRPKLVFTGNEIQAFNIAKQLAKQYKCLVHYTTDTKVFDTIKPEDEPPLVEG